MTTTLPGAARRSAAPVARRFSDAETSDGRRVTTPPLDLLYFVPRMDVGEARQVR